MVITSFFMLFLYAVDDASEALVQHKGRFKVTSADLSPKVGHVCWMADDPYFL